MAKRKAAVAETPEGAELAPTEFPPDEFPDPEQTPKDLGRTRGGAR